MILVSILLELVFFNRVFSVPDSNVLSELEYKELGV